MLHEKDERTGVLAADGKSLDHAQDDQENGSEDADLMKGREEAHEDRGNSHSDDRDHHGAFRAESVANPAEDNGTQWPDEKPCGKRAERGHQGDDGLIRRKEQSPDGCREVAVDGEVVEFHHISNESDEHGPNERGSGWLVQLLGLRHLYF